jgi:ArsR family transcriptional regulator, arsenate/arsenite/antimonite-responsive transcriptional repressor
MTRRAETASTAARSARNGSAQPRAGGLDVATAALCLAELGNPARLEAYRALVTAGPGGLAVGEIRDKLGIPDSTLTHHLTHLRHAGLITQEREGRVLRCRADFARMDALMRFMVSECCRGVALDGRNLCSTSGCG